LVELRHYELAMSQRFGASQPAIAGANHDVDQAVPRFIESHLAPKDARDIKVDMLSHGARGFRISSQLNHWLDWISNDVALSGGKQMHYESCSSLHGDTFGGS